MNNPKSGFQALHKDLTSGMDIQPDEFVEYTEDGFTHRCGGSKVYIASDGFQVGGDPVILDGQPMMIEDETTMNIDRLPVLRYFIGRELNPTIRLKNGVVISLYAQPVES